MFLKCWFTLFPFSPFLHVGRSMITSRHVELRRRWEKSLTQGKHFLIWRTSTIWGEQCRRVMKNCSLQIILLTKNCKRTGKWCDFGSKSFEKKCFIKEISVKGIKQFFKKNRLWYITNVYVITANWQINRTYDELTNWNYVQVLSRSASEWK